jgi:hypothetical protein
MRSSGDGLMTLEPLSLEARRGSLQRPFERNWTLRGSQFLARGLKPLGPAR